MSSPSLAGGRDWRFDTEGSQELSTETGRVLERRTAWATYAGIAVDWFNVCWYDWKGLRWTLFSDVGNPQCTKTAKSNYTRNGMAPLLPQFSAWLLRALSHFGLGCKNEFVFSMIKQRYTTAVALGALFTAYTIKLYL